MVRLGEIIKKVKCLMMNKKQYGCIGGNGNTKIVMFWFLLRNKNLIFLASHWFLVIKQSVRFQ